MNPKRLVPFATAVTIALVLAVIASTVVSSPAPAAAKQNGFEVVAPDGKYRGKTYAEWTRKWHQWILKVPADVNPMLDMTGENCAEGQKGPVWFLTGVFGGGTIERRCDVPNGQPVFFPVQNWMWLPFPTDPPMSEEEKAYWEATAHDAIAGAEATASIDDVEIDDLMRYEFNSGWFDTWMPDDNLIDYIVDDPEVCDWPEGDSGPHYNDGIYLMVELAKGNHTIHFTGWDGGLDVTYRIQVK